MSSENGPKQASMFSQAEPRASHSASRDCAPDWMIHAETSRSSILRSLNATIPTGWYGKTSPASCPAMADGTLVPLSGRWFGSGIARAGECLTLNTSEFHNDADVCFLSQILETGVLPRRYYLSRKACKGILRRAEERGKVLPRTLQKALEAIAEG